MPGDLELAAVAELRRALPDANVHRDSPDWLMRPGRVECGPHWDLVQSVYRALTQRDLCETMPSGERRQIDAVIEREREPPRIFEFDESQHFNVHRAVTLRLYPGDVETAFPLETWLSASETSTKKLRTTGGWGKAKPPLFPEPGGRHLQRAFRDALADLLPAVHGWAPTLRVADFEVQEWIYGAQAGAVMGNLLEDRVEVRSWRFSIAGEAWRAAIPAVPTEETKRAFWQQAVPELALQKGPPPPQPSAVVCRVTARTVGQRSRRPARPR